MLIQHPSRGAAHASGESQDFVYVLDGDILRRTPVKTGVITLTSIQIVDGLHQGESVALSVTQLNGQPLVDKVPVQGCAMTVSHDEFSWE